VQICLAWRRAVRHHVGRSGVVDGEGLAVEIFGIGTGEVVFLVVLLGAAAVGATVAVRALLRWPRA
jgi:hypothetical protein